MPAQNGLLLRREVLSAINSPMPIDLMGREFFTRCSALAPVLMTV